MYWLFLVLLAVFGAIIGSFLNVVISRHGVSGISGRSRCVSCDSILGWYDLIPIASFIILRARCRKCGGRISWRYIFIELLTAIGFTIIGIVSPDLITLVAGLLLIPIVIILAMYDIKHYILLPGYLWIFGIVSTGIRAYWDIVYTGTLSLDTYLLSIILAVPFFLLWYFSRGRLIGFGDIVLVFWMGMGLGLVGGAAAVFLASWIGALVGIIIGIYRRAVNGSSDRILKTRIAFGPFLLAGFLVVYCVRFYGIIDILAQTIK